jgi:hypothetical protein
VWGLAGRGRRRFRVRVRWPVDGCRRAGSEFRISGLGVSR